MIKSAFKTVTGKPTENILLGLPRRKMEDNIRNRYQYEERGRFGSG
jgi:hypothetical protein